MHGKIFPGETEWPAERLKEELLEEKRKRAMMRRREERFGVIADSTPIAIMLYQDERWLYINRAAETIYGYSIRELFDIQFLDLVHPDYKTLLRNIQPDEETTVEFKIRTKNGRDKWVSGTKTFAEIEDRPVTVISVLDITDRKQAEEALRISEEKYRSLVETATDVIFTLDAQLRITYISPTVTRLRGLTVEEAMAQNITEILTPASCETAMKTSAEEMSFEAQPSKDKNRIRSLELEEYCKDGSTIWTESIFNAIRNEEGQFIGMLGITRDITERKRAQKERERLIDEKRRALPAVKILSGMLPICSSCKKIRDDSGYWNQIETYIKSHSEANFSHGLCPDCIKRLYPNYQVQEALDAASPLTGKRA